MSAPGERTDRFHYRPGYQVRLDDEEHVRERRCFFLQHFTGNMDS
jgi:hypothetical protein